ncbi:MAG: heavy-metal-associated domain-containing protein [SAR324 cluster bacterium]|nr:heavy-metal-associated domain-containing protein [SAR324 cluster bacterium]
MTCESCAAGAQFSLERLEGVASASVSYAESKGVVVYDPEKVTLEQMIQAISDTGYRASVLSEPVAYDGDLKNDGEQVVSSREPYWNMTKGYGMMRGNCRGFMAVDNW